MTYKIVKLSRKLFGSCIRILFNFSGAISTTENEKSGYVGMPRIQSYGDLNPDHKVSED